MLLLAMHVECHKDEKALEVLSCCHGCCSLFLVVLCSILWKEVVVVAFWLSVKKVAWLKKVFRDETRRNTAAVEEQSF